MTVDNKLVAEQLRVLHRQRDTLIKGRIMQTNVVGAYARYVLGYDPGQGSMRQTEQTGDDLARLKKQAGDMVALIERTEDPEQIADVPLELVMVVGVMREARRPLEDKIKELGKEMEKLSSSLPVAPWVKSRSGFGLLNLARIVAETGDLVNYANPAKVWKRMGYDVYDGAAPSTWKVPSWRPRDPSKEDWIAMGYNDRRRSVVYNLEVCLLKAAANPWRYIYDKKKAEFLARGTTKMRAHRHGLRCMGKQVIKELWCEWNEKEPTLPEFVTKVRTRTRTAAPAVS